MATKYYKVIKDTPQWEIGAILQNTGSNGGYTSVDEIFDKDHTVEGYYETKAQVENAADFFQRVYPVNLVTRTVYKIKEEAKAMIAKNYTE